MKHLSENLPKAPEDIQNFSIKTQGSKQSTPLHGSINDAGKMITKPTQHTQGIVAVHNPKTIASVIASMQQRNSLTISAVSKQINIPKYDEDGKIYAWEYGTQETGEYLAKFNEYPSENEMACIQSAVTPGTKHGIQTALEILAQIKPIGRSDVKQSQRIAYLTFDLIDEGISEFVVNELCREYRRSKDHVFFPEHGDFLDRAKKLMKKYTAILNALNPPDPKPEAVIKKTLREEAIEKNKMPWDGKTWESMENDVKSELWKFCKSLPSPHVAKIYVKTYNIDYDLLHEWAEQC